MSLIKSTVSEIIHSSLESKPPTLTPEYLYGVGADIIRRWFYSMYELVFVVTFNDILKVMRGPSF